MIKPRFCYRIPEEAGLAYDEEGNSVCCYVEASLPEGEPMSQEDYDKAHEGLKDKLSEQLDIPKGYFERISQEEYDLNHKEDTE